MVALQKTKYFLAEFTLNYAMRHAQSVPRMDKTQCQDEVRIQSGRTQKLKVAKQCTMGFHITFREMEHFFLQINIVISIFIENC